MILIFTNKGDTHPTPVIKLLHGMGVPVFRLNSEAILTDYHFCWHNDENECRFSITNIHSGLTLEGKNLTAVWDRRPEHPEEIPLHNTETINKFNLDEAKGFIRFFRGYISQVPSLGSIAYDNIASSKMLQFEVARRVGFNVPRTCFSNRKVDIVGFASQFEEVALKVIDSDGIDLQDGTEKVFYTQKINSEVLFDTPDETFLQTANFVQEYVPKAYELRVTVVCDKVFSCRIDSQLQDDSTGKIDFRQGYDSGMRHSIHQLPEDIAHKCFLYLQTMRINYGAFDFAVTPSEEYVFLECNPNGQWQWIEEETGMKISEAIADCLSHPDKIRVY